MVMKVQVCIGSSCHLRGSYDVIKRLEELVAMHNLSDKVEISAAFCLGHCTNGVTIQVDDRIITGTSKENIEDIFSQYILKGCMPA